MIHKQRAGQQEAVYVIDNRHNTHKHSDNALIRIIHIFGFIFSILIDFGCDL